MVHGFRFFLSLLLLVPLGQLQAELPDRAVESALRGSDIAPLFELVDTERLADRAGLDRRAARAFGQAREQLATQRFNRHRLYTRGERLLLRLDLAPRGLNWLELSWHDPESETPLTDWHDHALGIRLSELVAAVAMLLEGSDGRRFLEALEEDPEGAWEGLPEKLRRNPAAPRLFWLSCDGADCHVSAMEAMEALDDDEPALWRLDLAAARDDAEGFREVLDRMEERVGPDPGLTWLAAADALRAGDCDDVVHDVQDAMTQWPDYQPLYPVMIQCLVLRDQYRQALQFFTVMEEHFGVQMDWDALGRHPVYRELVTSEEFRRWKQERQE